MARKRPILKVSVYDHTNDVYYGICTLQFIATLAENQDMADTSHLTITCIPSKPVTETLSDWR